MPARTQNASQHVLTKPVSTQNVSQLVLIKLVLCQRGHKIYLNLWWPKHYHASEDTKFISTCVGQTHPMPAKPQNVSQLVLIKLLPCQRALKMYRNKCWRNSSHASEDTKYISNCVDQTYPMPAKIKCVNMCWPNASNACKDAIYITISVKHLCYGMPAKTQNVSKLVLKKPFPC